MPLVHRKRVATVLAFLVCLAARPIADGFLLSPSFAIARSSKVRVCDVPSFSTLTKRAGWM